MEKGNIKKNIFRWVSTKGEFKEENIFYVLVRLCNSLSGQLYLIASHSTGSHTWETCPNINVDVIVRAEVPHIHSLNWKESRSKNTLVPVSIMLCIDITLTQSTKYSWLLLHLLILGSLPFKYRLDSCPFTRNYVLAD